MREPASFFLPPRNTYAFLQKFLVVHREFGIGNLRGVERMMLILIGIRKYTAENTENFTKKLAKNLQVKILRIMFVLESNNP